MFANLPARLLRTLPPETAHAVAIAALRRGLAGGGGIATPALEVQAFGCRFANPLGLAAGFDKNAQAVLPLLRLGFGFVEAGTVTKLPQPGNPRPRLFRLPKERAAINRMGFNNGGAAAFPARLPPPGARPGALGINIGINKTGADPERDYPALVALLGPQADYVAINVSSPNTPGLRDLQSEARLRGILLAIRNAVPQPPPLFVKLAPDLADAALDAVVDLALHAGIAGLILCNTSLFRPPGLRGRHAGEAGGLSGPPLFARSTEMLRLAWRRAAGKLTLIGVGGIATGADALKKIEAGATLVQFYTAFAYAGPGLVPRVLRELDAARDAAGYTDIAAAIGARA